VGRLTELVAKLEEDLLAADAGGGGGGAGGGERHKAGINGIVADGEARADVRMQQDVLCSRWCGLHEVVLRQRERT